MSLAGPLRWPHRVLVTANALVALSIVVAASAFGYVEWRVGQIHTEKLSALTAGSGSAFTLLVVGSDSRAALDEPGDTAIAGTPGETPGQRSDTIILLRVVPRTHQLMILSIPRDLWVPIPGQQDNRINSAYDTGANLLIQTIRQDLGIPVNHFAEVNFDSFRAITDAVGGVRYYFPTPAMDAYSGLRIPAAGCYNLTGDQALAFVRSRHYEYFEDGSWNFEAESDLARIHRQQSFIKKMIVKAKSKLADPLALNSIIGGVTKNLTVDSGFNTNLILSLVKSFRSVDVSAIPSVTLPTYSWVTAGGADVLGLQQPQASQAIAAFLAFGSRPPPEAHHSSKHHSSPARRSGPKVTVRPASVSIEIANGTGTAGQAGQLSDMLAKLGYNVGITTSPAVRDAKTVVEYAPDSAAAAQQVAASVPGGASVTEDAALSPTPYNLEVITGSSLTAASVAAAPTSTTTIPGTGSAVYELPGSSGPPPASC